MSNHVSNSQNSTNANVNSLPFETTYDDFTQKKVVDALYQQWKQEQQMEKARVLAANIDLFFGVKPSSETSSLTSTSTKSKTSSGGLSGLIKRGCDKLLGRSKQAVYLEDEDLAESGSDQINTVSSTSRSNSIDRDRRNAKGMGYSFSDFDVMTLESSYNILNRE
ncbi:hypothetical protein E3P99_04091 [Wallemia hederae]|uniref:Uncharacterized protein n=1 Tax=Wallemia hederae TaxID=1540922 RepID=A0A4T0FAQ9_9BASI|nr:hypothetical protein E3P99_04091 [Wallemia hederae]